MKNNKLKIVLFLLVIGIWGVIAYRIISYNKNENGVTFTEIGTDSFIGSGLESTDSSRNLYVRIKRDPFVKSDAKNRTDQKVSNQVKSHLTQTKDLNFTVSGVIINGESRLVVIHDIENQTTVFLKENEVYKSIKIYKIFEDRVEYTSNKKRKSISVFSHTDFHN